MALSEKWETLSKFLDSRIIKSVKDAFNFNCIMPVQKAVIPHFTTNKDVIVEAATGSGKTLAYILPCLQILLKNIRTIEPKLIYAVILAPTRELAMQIEEISKNLITKLGIHISVCLMIGGSNKTVDYQNFIENGGNILIASPGKLREILETKHYLEEIHFRNLEVLILDEADRLLDVEFEKDIHSIIAKMPKQRRTGLFSATINASNMKDLMTFGLRNPTMISLKVATDDSESAKKTHMVPETLKNEYLVAENRMEKITLMFNFLLNNKNLKTIVFLNTCASVDFYYKIISNFSAFKGFSIFAMHGQMKQKKRVKICQEFMKKEAGILIATDVVARGIDFVDVHFILQIDPPQDPSFFVHRVGRTARVGKLGHAILFLEEHEDVFVNYLKNKSILMSLYDKKQINITKTQEDLCKEIKQISTQDRDIIEKGKRAFVTFLRSYKEHDLKYIFEFKHLDLGQIANSFFLLRIPRVKEILGKKIESFVQSEIDPESIPFKDKNQQNQFFQKKDNNKAKQETKLVGIQKENQKIQEIKKNKDIKNDKTKRKRAVQQRDLDEFEEYQFEDKLVKKLKSGKISLEQYKEKMKDIDDKELLSDGLTKNVLFGKSRNKKKH